MIVSHTSQLDMRRLKAPQENRRVVADPPWNEVAQTVDANLESRAVWEYDFQGISSRRLISEARAELCHAAVDWMSDYRSISSSLPCTDAPIFLAGHQPQMFHPGVWLKNFALGRLAEKHGARAVNLIIDSDAASNPALMVPGGKADSPIRELLAFDVPDLAVPYEERQIEDSAIFESFAIRAVEKIFSLVPKPLLEKYWPMVLERSRAHRLLGASLAQGRHLLEGTWGSSTWEVPQSAVCDRPAFFRFTAHLLAQLSRFLPIYNAAVDEYRQLHRIRNRAHPVPDLAVEGDWLEAPFWIWTAKNPRRRRLFVRASGKETAISDRHGLEVRLSLTPDGDAGRATEQLAELRRQGVKIRSRALITTLWARLVLGDLFVHGIGGGNYDRVTDAIIERFFGRTPPQFMVLSATLFLPVERTAKPADDPAKLAAQLRELTYHPERYLDSAARGSQNGDSALHALLTEKHRLIAAPQTREKAKAHCRGIRAINERLQPWLANLRADILRRRDSALAEAHKEKILSSREYAFCLYPEDTIREFFDGLLENIV